MTLPDRRASLLPFVLIMGCDLLVYFAAYGRATDGIVIAILTILAVMQVASGLPTFSKATPLIAFIILVVLQWPRPHLWCLNAAVCVHLCWVLARGRRSTNSSYSHMVLVASAIVLWYCLNNHSNSWHASILPLLGAVAMVVSWMSVRKLGASPASRPLAGTMITAVTGAILVGMVVGKPVAHAVQVSLAKLGLEAPRASRRFAGKGGGGSADGLGLNYEGEKGASSAAAYLAVKNPSRRPHQYRPPFYLRESGFLTFTGKRWMSASPDRVARVDQADGTVDAWTATRPPVHSYLSEYQVFLPDVNSPWLPTLPGTTSINVGELTMTKEDGYFVQARRGGYLSYRGRAARYQYRELPDSAMEPAEVDESYYQMPDVPITPKLEETTATVIGDVTEPAEKIRRILGYLTNSHTYLIQKDASRATLENFLYGEKKGHCTLFASTCTLMMRSAGLPTRIAVGYCGGKYDEKEGVFVFDGTTRHAWCEFKTKNHGWIIIDPTPPATTQPGYAKDSDFAKQLPLYSPLEKERVKEGELPALELKRFDLRKVATYVLALAFLISWSIYLFQFIKSRKNRGGDSFDRLPAPRTLTDFFDLFCASFAKRGVPKRRYQTAWEFVDALKANGVVANEWDDMIGYYYGVCYEEKPPSETLEAQFMERIEALKETPSAEKK